MVSNMKNTKRDLTFILRDPMMLLLFIVPVIIPIVFKLLLTYGLDLLNRYIYFDFSPYNGYLLVLAVILIPTMLGAVTGFQMLDEKDGNIDELLSITPMGRLGYLLTRVNISLFMTFVYVIYTYLVLDVYSVSVFVLILLSVLLSLYSMMIGCLLYILAEDKVKGLTYVKGLSFIMVFAFAKLIDNNYLIIVSNLFPTYWIAELVLNPSLATIIYSIAVHLLWFLLATKKVLKSSSF